VPGPLLASAEKDCAISMPPAFPACIRNSPRNNRLWSRNGLP